MVLAPLFGFLGGSMSGVGGTVGGPDPLAVWLLGGMVIGGIGGILKASEKHPEDVWGSICERPGGTWEVQATWDAF